MTLGHKGIFAGAVALIVAAVLPMGCKQRPPALCQVKVSQFHMGMMVDLVVWAPSVPEGQDACARAFNRIRQLNLVLSDYEPDSELSRLCRQAGHGPVKVSDELFKVLQAASELSRLTDGHYDVTAAPAIRLWREARRVGRLPDPAEMARALELAGNEKLRLDPAQHTAELTREGMLLDLGSIAKGYVGDEALAVLRSLGYPSAAFVAGGDMVFGDAPPGTSGWPVQPADPGVPLTRLSRCAFSVSGDTEQFVEIGGVRYSHVIDARTSQALTNRQMCVVVAPAGLASDPLSTIGTLVPAARLQQLVHERFPGAQAWVFTAR
jgi:FAD:protein FMN transferase